MGFLENALASNPKQLEEFESFKYYGSQNEPEYELVEIYYKEEDLEINIDE